MVPGCFSAPGKALAPADRTFILMTTKRIRGLLWLITLSFSFATQAWGQLVSTTLFEPGALSTYVQGNVDDTARRYNFYLEKGQSVKVQLVRSEAPVSITIQDPDGAALLPPSTDPYAVKTYDLIAPQSGVYNLVLRAKETTDFRLSVSLAD